MKKQQSVSPKSLLFTFAFFAFATLQLSAQMGFWTLRDTFPPGGRSAATGFGVGAGAYVCCGIDSGSYKRSTYMFVPSTNSWTQVQSLGGVTGSGLGRDVTMSFVINTNAYVVGGQGSIAYFNDTWKYDAFNDVWTQMQTFNGGGRRSAVGFAINGKGYIALGQASTGLKSDCWEYNPATNVWVQKANFPGTPRRLAVAFVINNIAYVGTGDDGVFKGDFYAFDPTTNSWTTKAPLTGTPRYGAIGFALNGKGYVGFGYDNTLMNRKDFWEYNPTSNSWLQMANFPGTARSNATVVTLANNRAYMGLGYDSLYENDWWEFDPLSNGITENLMNENQVNIFPNPMHESATIELDAGIFGDNDALTISIFDLQGNVVKEMEVKNASRVVLDGNEMTSGMYLVRVVSQKHGVLTKRLVVE